MVRSASTEPSTGSKRSALDSGMGPSPPTLLSTAVERPIQRRARSSNKLGSPVRSASAESLRLPSPGQLVSGPGSFSHLPSATAYVSPNFSGGEEQRACAGTDQLTFLLCSANFFISKKIQIVVHGLCAAAVVQPQPAPQRLCVCRRPAVFIVLQRGTLTRSRSAPESHRLPSAWPPSARGNLGFASTAARNSSPGSSPGYMNRFKQFAISGGDSVRPSFQPTALASPPHARL